MSEITRYVLVNSDDQEDDHEYETHEFEEAKSAARKRGCAVIARTYIFDDSELVWTPNGADVWPPTDKDLARRKGVRRGA